MPSQTWFDRLRFWVAEKIFRLGPAVVERSQESWGTDPTTYAPEAYGEYIATSVAVYACANLRAKNLAKLPLRLWKVDARGNKQEVASGQLYELLAKVNPFWTFGRLIRMTELARCLWGSGYWTLERGKAGRSIPREIWWARPDRMRVLPHSVSYITGYVYENLGERIPFRRDEVIWLPMDNPIDEFAGLSPIAAARLSADLGTAGLRSNKKLFDQGLQLGGIISPENASVSFTKEQAEELELKFERRFKGVDKAHKWAVLSGGVKATPLGVNPKDAEFIGQMKWSLGDICRVYTIAPELLGDQDHATYNNRKQAYEALWSDCLEPEGKEIAEWLTEQLLPMFKEADLAEFDFSGVSALQEDRSEMVTQMKSLWDMGVPLNRLLQEFMPNLLPEGTEGYAWGDVWWAPQTLIEAGTAPEPPPPQTPQEGMERALRLFQVIKAEQKALPVPKVKAIEYGSEEHERRWKAFMRRTDRHEVRVVELLRDLWRRQQESVLARLRSGKALRPAPGRKDDEAVLEEPFDRAQWGKRFKQEMLPLLRLITEDAGSETLDELRVGISFDVSNPEVVRFLERRAQRFAREVNETTWNELKRSLGEGIETGESIGQLAERVQSIYRRYGEPGDGTLNRAETIARTETIGASNGGSLLAAKQSGVVEGKTWLAALDERTRESHIAAHGQTVGLDEDFKVGGASGPAPGQIGVASEDINCRCTVVFTVKED